MVSLNNIGWDIQGVICDFVKSSTEAGGLSCSNENYFQQVALEQRLYSLPLGASVPTRGVGTASVVDFLATLTHSFPPMVSASTTTTTTSYPYKDLWEKQGWAQLEKRGWRERGGPD